MKSLSFKISLSVLSAVLLIFTAIFIYNYIISSDLLLKNVENNAMHLADGKAQQIEKLLEVSAAIPQTLAHSLITKQHTPEELEGLLHRIVAANEEVFGSCIAFEPYVFDPDSVYYAPYSFRDKDGISFKYLNSPELDYFSQEWYQVTAKSKKPHWTEPYFDEGGGNTLMCTYSFPLIDDEGFKGVITVDLTLDWLKYFIETIKVYENGYAFLVSGNGVLITDPMSTQNEMQNLFDVADRTGNQELAKAAESMVKGEKGFMPYDSPLLKGDEWLYYTPLSSSGWSLAIILPESEFMSDLYILNRDLLFIAAAGFVILLLIVIIISIRITKPLRSLASIASIIGKGNFEVSLPSRKTGDEIGRLSESITQMQLELKNYIRNLKETTAAKEKIESELQIARDIQLGIIPKIFPPFPHIDHLDLYALLKPARDVGGDLYDFFFMDDQHLCFAIGDVSGKGVPASLFMAITRTLLRSEAKKEYLPEMIITDMNNDLCKDNVNAMFVTLFLGVLNIETGKLRYCNAGHNYPYLVNEGKIKVLENTHGTPLGAIEELEYASSEIILERGDLLFLYTDGVTEAINPEELQYTEHRLEELLTRVYRDSTEMVAREVLNDLTTFVGEAEQFDDITMLNLKWY
jgi:sigma-B regulation protein RsbU (phosphoserine phosphatase)